MPWGVAAAAISAGGSIYSANQADKSARSAEQRAAAEAAAARARLAAKKYTSPFGVASDTSFQYNAAAGTAATTADSRGQLQQLVAGGLGVDPAAAQSYQNAFINARLPQMQQQQALQQQGLQAQIGATGMAGSSGSALRQALQQQFANQQTASLQDQAILGGRQMALQDASSKQAEAGFLQGLSQQDIANTLSAQNAAAAARLGNVSANQSAGNSAVSNALAARKVSLATSQNNLKNLNSAVGAGWKVGNAASDYFGNSSGGGGGGGGQASSQPYASESSIGSGFDTSLNVF